MVVEGLGEVVAVVDEEAALVEVDRLAHHQVLGSHVLLHLLLARFHGDRGEAGRQLGVVFGDLGEWDGS